MTDTLSTSTGSNLTGRRPQAKITFLPLDQATQLPGDGWWEVYTNCWWVHYPGQGLAFWHGVSPQCNANESIARRVQRAYHPEAELIFLERVCVQHKCEKYE